MAHLNNPFLSPDRKAPADITERAMLIRINKTFQGISSAQKLYDFTRSSWRVGERRNLVEYAFSVYKGTIIEVYKIHYWELATEKNVPSGQWDSGKGVGRYQFIGEVDAEMSKKYKGKTVSHYFKQGDISPTKYINV